MSEDELLSVYDVSRLWGTGLSVVLQLLESGDLLSLDRGLLIRERQYDLPLIRRSWAEALRQESSGAERTLAPGEGNVFHPAVEAAFDFHSALYELDAQGVYDACSEATRMEETPESLLAIWQSVGSHLTQQRAGVGSTVYSLAPLDAVSTRVIADAPLMPRAVTKATPASLVDVLPLVRDPVGWRVDLPLFERRDEWSHLLTEPLPVSSEGGDSDCSSDGSANAP